MPTPTRQTTTANCTRRSEAICDQRLRVVAGIFGAAGPCAKGPAAEAGGLPGGAFLPSGAEAWNASSRLGLRSTMALKKAAEPTREGQDGQPRRARPRA